MSENVRICNPVSGPGYTSARAAARYIKRGLAEQVTPGVIRFVRGDYRDPQPLGPISVGMASLDAIRGLPVAGDVVRLITGHKPEQPPCEYPKAQVIRRSAVPICSVPRDRRLMFRAMPKTLPGWEAAPCL